MYKVLAAVSKLTNEYSFDIITFTLLFYELTTLTDAILSSKGMFSCCHKKRRQKAILM